MADGALVKMWIADNVTSADSSRRCIYYMTNIANIIILKSFILYKDVFHRKTQNHYKQSAQEERAMTS